MNDTRDDDLIARLRGLAGQVDPPPQIVLESARAAFLMSTSE